MSDLTPTQEHALTWARQAGTFTHREMRRAEITGPTMYSLMRRGLVTLDHATHVYTAAPGVSGLRYQTFCFGGTDAPKAAQGRRT